jgi:type IV pilus assembly protein PilE
MIVVAVVAILASVAISQYNKQVRKSRRAEAKQVITDLALRQEKWRSNHTKYFGTDSLPADKTAFGYTAAIDKPYYTITVNNLESATTFTLRATPKAGTDQIKDVCTPYLQLQSVSGVVTKTPATNSCWQ